MSEDDATLEPHIAEFGRGSRGTRYPNPFFDLGQQYAPRTVKELFKWCTYFYYTNPLVNSTITKVSRYPITNIVIEEADEKVKKLWLNIYDNVLHIKDRLMEVNLDQNVYGNAIVSLHFPFTRYLVCGNCKHRVNIKEVSWKFLNYGFTWNCPKCSQGQHADSASTKQIKDVPYRAADDIKIIRWNPENIAIRYNEATAESHYYYNVSRILKLQITSGEKEILESLPLLFIQAVKKNRLIKLAKQNIFHLKKPTLAEKDMGWGKPLIQPVMKELYYMATLRKAQEAIAQEHIVPFDFLYPTPNAQMDPFVHTDLGNWKTKVEEAIKKHRSDPNYKAVMPVPVGFGRLGGDGKMLMMTPEINTLTQQIVGGMGIPQEFIFGGLNWCAAPRHHLFTSQGLLKLGEICPEEIGFKKAENIKTATKDGVESIALVHRTVKKIQHTIDTRIGLNLTGSKIHKLWVLNEDMSMSWKEMQDIKTGDRVAFPRKTDIWGDKELSLEMCRLFGYLVSEGTITRTATRFSNTNLVLVEDFINCIKKVYGVEATYRTITFTEDSNHYGMKPLYEVGIYDAKAKASIKKIMKWGYSKDKHIPRIIRESKKECVFEFLKALFEGDGCNYVSPNLKQTISYASISPLLLEEVQLSLMNAGIISYKYPDYLDENGDRLNVPCLHIRSDNAKKFLKEIGFVTKNDAYDNSGCNPESFRCEYEKIPFLLERLKDLKKLSNGKGAWVKDSKELVLDKEIYNTKEVADLIGRDVSSVRLYLKSGKIKGKREVRKDGRYPTYIIKKAAIQSFMDSHGVQKRAPVGQTTWEINSNNTNHVNWESVKELDPKLYVNYQAVVKADFFWDEVVTKSVSSEEIEMCDLTVHNTHSYVISGLVSHNTGSSVTLRALQNDFQHNQSQLLELTKWIGKKIKVFLRIPGASNIRFLDFKMADDVQKRQQILSLNAQRKVSDETLLTEFGLDYNKEKAKILQEMGFQNELQDITARAQAKTSGESQIISYNYQQKMQEIQEKAMLKKQQLQGPQISPFGSEQTDLMAQVPGQPQPGMDASQATPQPGATGEAHASGAYSNAQGDTVPGSAPGQTAGGDTAYMDIHKTIKSWATKLMNMDPNEQRRMLTQIKQQMPQFGDMVEKHLNQLIADGASAQAPGATGAGTTPANTSINMGPVSEKGAPRSDA